MESEFAFQSESYEGIGGFGAFFKIRLAKKKYGYVADTDVAPKFSPQKVGQNVKVKENPVFEQVEDMKKGRQKEPVYFTRYLGVAVGSGGLH